MFSLISFLLLIGLAIYGVFFLLFKVIWMLLKKSSNMWPLILAGISTLLFAGAIIGTMIWGVYKIAAPFRQMVSNITSNEAPIYGNFTYTDSKYNFAIDTQDGMDYSDWMQFNDVDFKVGINTNVLKKNKDGKRLEEPFVFSLFIVIPKPNGETDNPLDELAKGISEMKDNRNIEIHSVTPVQLNNKNAYKIQATVYANSGDALPVVATITQLDDAKFLNIITGCVGENNQPQINKIADSFKLLN